MWLPIPVGMVGPFTCPWVITTCLRDGEGGRGTAPEGSHEKSLKSKISCQAPFMVPFPALLFLFLFCLYIIEIYFFVELYSTQAACCAWSWAGNFLLRRWEKSALFASCTLTGFPGLDHALTTELRRNPILNYAVPRLSISNTAPIRQSYAAPENDF